MAAIANLTRPKSDPRIIDTGRSSRTGPDRLAHALGWFSIGLGLVELVAPREITRALGVEGREKLVRAFGAREIASGVMTLSTETQVGLWSRVAGDGLDLYALSRANTRDNGKRDNVALAILMVGGVAALDLVCARGVANRHARPLRQRSYRHRSGFPKGLRDSRGAAATMGQRGKSGAVSGAGVETRLR